MGGGGDGGGEGDDGGSGVMGRCGLGHVGWFSCRRVLGEEGWGGLGWDDQKGTAG